MMYFLFNIHTHKQSLLTTRSVCDYTMFVCVYLLTTSLECLLQVWTQSTTIYVCMNIDYSVNLNMTLKLSLYICIYVYLCLHVFVQFLFVCLRVVTSYKQQMPMMTVSISTKNIKTLQNTTGFCFHNNGITKQQIPRYTYSQKHLLYTQICNTVQ